MSKTYKIRPEGVWEAVREAYLSGISAKECAQRFDVTEAAIAWRARNHHWRKRDLTQISPHFSASMPGQAQESGPPPADPQEAARTAFDAAAQAMTEGRLAEAQALVRLAQSLSGLVVP